MKPETEKMIYDAEAEVQLRKSAGWTQKDFAHALRTELETPVQPLTFTYHFSQVQPAVSTTARKHEAPPAVSVTDCKYEVLPVSAHFSITHAVFSEGGHSSICYTTDEKRARMIAAAMRLFAATGALDRYLRNQGEFPGWYDEVLQHVWPAYNYAAMDSSGYWYAYKDRPKQGEHFWYSDTCHAQALGKMSSLQGVPIWTETLITVRPEAEPKTWTEVVRARIPHGYNYAAMDRDGHWYAHKSMPVLRGATWDSGGHFYLGALPITGWVPDWTETLIGV